MKRIISFIFLMFIMVSIFCINSNAENSAELLLSTDSNIKAGKTFNIYVSFSDSCSVLRAGVCFDPNKLSFKSAELINNDSNEYLKCNFDGNEVVILYANDNPNCLNETGNIIKLRFSPINRSGDVYMFEGKVYESGNKNAQRLNIFGNPVLNVTVTKEGSKSEIFEKNLKSSSLNSESPLNKELSGGNVPKEDKPDIYLSQIQNNNDLSSAMPENEYSLSENDVTFKENNFIDVILVLSLFVAVAGISFRLGAKKNK